MPKESYQNSDEYPTEGSGQGISWAGPRWTATSTSISNIMKKTNTGMRFIDPTGEILIEKNSDFFVDDTATGVTDNAVKDGRSVLEHLRKDEQKHAFLLFCFGTLTCIIQMYILLLYF